jgi:hypothetical protein
MTRKPRLNHVAMSLTADALGDEGRAAITAFYGEVFGWHEYDMLTIDRERLVLRVHSDEQFVFLIADDPPMVCPRLDHFGMSVGTLDEFDDLYARCQAKAAADPDVDLIERSMENHYDVLHLHSFYVRYKLPMMVEVQLFDYQAPAGVTTGA